MKVTDVKTMVVENEPPYRGGRYLQCSSTIEDGRAESPDSMAETHHGCNTYSDQAGGPAVAAFQPHP